MKKIFGFRPPDEMQRRIIAKSQINAYFFLTAALFIWTMWESIGVFTGRSSRVDLTPCALLCGAALVQSFSQLIMSRNAVKDDDEGFDQTPLFKIVVLMCVVGVVFSLMVGVVTLLTVRP